MKKGDLIKLTYNGEEVIGIFCENIFYKTTELTRKKSVPFYDTLLLGCDGLIKSYTIWSDDEEPKILRES